jgi:hypothetical protein
VFSNYFKRTCSAAELVHGAIPLLVHRVGEAYFAAAHADKAAWADEVQIKKE